MSQIVSDRRVQFPRGTTISIGASQTNTLISGASPFSVSSPRSLRVDILVGKVVVSNANTAKCQHTAAGDYGVWTDGKTSTITASTEKTFTTDVGDEPTYLECTSHGLSEGQSFTVSADTGSDALPEGLTSNQVYYARVVDANTLEATLVPGGEAVEMTDDETGNVSLRAVRKFSITYQDTVAGDQSHTPLPDLARVVISNGASDSVELVDVITSQVK